MGSAIMLECLQVWVGESVFDVAVWWRLERWPIAWHCFSN
jgi:hypothetical protein